MSFIDVWQSNLEANYMEYSEGTEDIPFEDTTPVSSKFSPFFMSAYCIGQ